MKKKNCVDINPLLNTIHQLQEFGHLAAQGVFGSCLSFPKQKSWTVVKWKMRAVKHTECRKSTNHSDRYQKDILAKSPKKHKNKSRLVLVEQRSDERKITWCVLYNFNKTTFVIGGKQYEQIPLSLILCEYRIYYKLVLSLEGQIRTSINHTKQKLMETICRELDCKPASQKHFCKLFGNKIWIV